VSGKTKRLGVVAVSAAMIGMTLVGMGGAAGASPASASTSLAGSVAPFTTDTPAIGAVSGATQLTIQLWLKPSLAAATSLATAVSTPGGPLYHHYLSPARYTTRYEASQTKAAAVESWLRSEGFTQVHADSQRVYVRATASVATIDSAFKVQMELFRSSKAVNAGRYALRSNNRAVSLPSSLAPMVIGVTGLDNAAPASTLDRDSRLPAGAAVGASAGAAKSSSLCSRYYGQHKTSGLPKQFGTTTFPTEVCGYSAAQIRAAYGANMRNTGKGQTVALVELGLTPDMFLTLQDYARHNHMPAPSSGRYAELSLGQGSACGDPFDVEEQLDVESSYDMAPAASQLVVGGDSCNEGDFGLQGLFNADEAVLGGKGDRPLASVASNSWESGDESQPADLTNIEHAFLVQAAAEGVGMYFSSGDGSGVLAPSSDPFAIAVGGTTLGIGSTNKRLFETGWSTAVSNPQNHRWVLLGEQGAAGGGPSLLWQQPRYQRGIVPPSLSTAPGDRPGAVRSASDIGADADPFTGFAVGLLNITPKHITYQQSDIGGTSLAAPLVAGMVAAAQQGQPAHFGFLNSVLYTLANTGAVHQVPPLTSHSPALFRGTACNARTCGLQILTTFDDQSFAMFGYTGQVSRRGYGNMSGIGTPRGQAFIRALRAAAAG
jgi:subtilase family serine protease